MSKSDLSVRSDIIVSVRSALSHRALRTLVIDTTMDQQQLGPNKQVNIIKHSTL